MASPRIAGLTLQGTVGKGGMAEVYRATNAHGHEYAVKLIRAAATRSAAIDLDREVRAQARLVHPHISSLRDVGIVSDADDPPEGFQPGCAYMVMNLASGSLADLLPLDSWGEARAVLLQMLDALAYAHARSVIHRDLKPANALIVSSDARPPTIQVADFGISVIFEGAPATDASQLGRVSGTPAYMSPEQVTGAWQNFGPWTDIYALGCIAWELVCGRPPFLADSVVGTLQQHLQAPRPRLAPRFGVPTGLQAWIHRAMAVDPTRRYRRAVDAARELLRLRANVDPGVEDVPSALSGETLKWTHTLAPLAVDGLSTTLAQEPRVELDVDRDDESALFDERPPIPPTWRGREFELQPAAAPALIALRPIPLVGRDEARDAVWAALRRSREFDRGEIVLLVGPSGSGRTQLAGWLAERARELGVAGRLWADFGPGGHGLAGLIRRTFLLWGVDEHAYAETLSAMIPRLEDDPFFEDDAQTLARLASTSSGNRREEFVALRRLIGRLGRINLPGLVLDDADHSPEALAFLEFLCQATLPACLIVASVDRSLLDDPTAPPELTGLLEASCVTRIELEPLSEREHHEFLRALAPLTPNAVEQLASASLGSPAFAVELVLDWLRSDRFVETDDGLKLSDDAAEMPPRTAHDVALSRCARVVRQVARPPDDAWNALEVAAVLGSVVEKTIWGRAIELTDLDLLLQQVAREGVGHEIPEGFAFANGLLREALVQRARDGGRYEQWHASCARAFGDPGDDPERLRRVANHWVEAGQPEEALEHLLHASRAVGRSHGTRARVRLLEYRDELLDRLGVEATDPRRVLGEIHRHRCFVEARPDECMELVARLGREGLLSDPRLAEQASRLASMACRRLQRPREALDFGRRAVEFARQDGDPARLSQSLLFQAYELSISNLPDEAAELLAEVEDLGAAAGFRSAWQLAIEARIKEARGELDEARRLLRLGIDQATEERAFALVRNFHARLGELERRAGNATRARQAYAVQLELARRAEEPFEVFVVECNLALTDVLAGDTGARATLAVAREKGLWLTTVTRGELACDVLDGRFDVARERLVDLPPPGDESLTADDPWLLDIAARAAVEAQQLELAGSLERRAQAERDALGIRE